MNTDLNGYICDLSILLHSYKAGRMPVDVFLNKSRSILDLVEPCMKEKADKLHSAWFDIEQAYAVALDRGEPLSNYQKYVNDGLASMEFQMNLLSHQH